MSQNNKEKTSRAQRMAEQYGNKLAKISGVKLEPLKVKHVETETLEILAKRRIAIAKLASFRDLLG